MKVYGYIIVITRTGADGTPFPLTSLSCYIGRSPECDIRVQLNTVSKLHCQITVEPSGKVYITNSSQANPTLLNGKELTAEQTTFLYHKDILSIADRLFRWEYAENSSFLSFHRKMSLSKYQNSPKPPNSDSMGCGITSRKRSNVDAFACNIMDLKKKKVSFGPHLSPEHFDVFMPPSSPIRKGEKPNICSPGYIDKMHNSPLSFSPTRSLLKRRSPTPIKPYLERSLKLKSPEIESKIEEVEQKVPNIKKYSNTPIRKLALRTPLKSRLVRSTTKSTRKMPSRSNKRWADVVSSGLAKKSVAFSLEKNNKSVVKTKRRKLNPASKQVINARTKYASIGHVDSPPTLFIYKKKFATPKVYRRGNKNLNVVGASCASPHIESIKDLFSPIQLNNTIKKSDKGEFLKENQKMKKKRASKKKRMKQKNKILSSKCILSSIKSVEQVTSGKYVAVSQNKYNTTAVEMSESFNCIESPVKDSKNSSNVSKKCVRVSERNYESSHTNKIKVSLDIKDAKQANAFKRRSAPIKTCMKNEHVVKKLNRRNTRSGVFSNAALNGPVTFCYKTSMPIQDHVKASSLSTTNMQNNELFDNMNKSLNAKTSIIKQANESLKNKSNNVSIELPTCTELNFSYISPKLTDICKRQIVNQHMNMPYKRQSLRSGQACRNSDDLCSKLVSLDKEYCDAKMFAAETVTPKNIYTCKNPRSEKRSTSVKGKVESKEQRSLPTRSVKHLYSENLSKSFSQSQRNKLNVMSENQIGVQQMNKQYERQHLRSEQTLSSKSHIPQGTLLQNSICSMEENCSMTGLCDKENCDVKIFSAETVSPENQFKCPSSRNVSTSVKKIELRKRRSLPTFSIKPLHSENISKSFSGSHQGSAASVSDISLLPNFTTFDFSEAVTPNISQENFVSPINGNTICSVKKHSKNANKTCTSTPKAGYMNVTGVKRLLKTPRQTAPLSSYCNVDNIAQLFKLKNKTIFNDSCLKAIKKLMTLNDIEADYSNVGGIKRLFSAGVDPQPDYSSPKGIKELFKVDQETGNFSEAFLTQLRWLFAKKEVPMCDYEFTEGLTELFNENSIVECTNKGDLEASKSVSPLPATNLHSSGSDTFSQVKTESSTNCSLNNKHNCSVISCTLSPSGCKQEKDPSCVQFNDSNLESSRFKNITDICCIKKDLSLQKHSEKMEPPPLAIRQTRSMRARKYSNESSSEILIPHRSQTGSKRGRPKQTVKATVNLESVGSPLCSENFISSVSETKCRKTRATNKITRTENLDPIVSPLSCFNKKVSFRSKKRNRKSSSSKELKSLSNSENVDSLQCRTRHITLVTKSVPKLEADLDLQSSSNLQNVISLQSGVKQKRIPAPKMTRKAKAHLEIKSSPSNAENLDSTRSGTKHRRTRATKIPKTELDFELKSSPNSESVVDLQSGTRCRTGNKRISKTEVDLVLKFSSVLSSENLACLKSKTSRRKTVRTKQKDTVELDSISPMFQKRQTRSKLTQTSSGSVNSVSGDASPKKYEDKKGLSKSVKAKQVQHISPIKMVTRSQKMKNLSVYESDVVAGSDDELVCKKIKISPVLRKKRN